MSNPSDQLTKTSAGHDDGNLRYKLDIAISALEFARDGYERTDIKHIDYRVGVYTAACDALDEIALPSAPNHQPHALSQATSPELLALIERAKSHVMTPEERYEQRRSFVRGMCPSSRDYSSWCAEVDKLLPPLPAPPSPKNTPRDSSESTTGGTAPDHTTMEERGR